MNAFLGLIVLLFLYALSAAAVGLWGALVVRVFNLFI